MAVREKKRKEGYYMEKALEGKIYEYSAEFVGTV